MCLWIFLPSDFHSFLEDFYTVKWMCQWDTPVGGCSCLRSQTWTKTNDFSKKFPFQLFCVTNFSNFAPKNIKNKLFFAVFCGFACLSNAFAVHAEEDKFPFVSICAVNEVTILVYGKVDPCIFICLTMCGTFYHLVSMLLDFFFSTRK